MTIGKTVDTLINNICQTYFTDTMNIDDINNGRFKKKTALPYELEIKQIEQK